MKFSVLVAMLAEDLEEQAIESAKAAGAGGITILNGRGLGAEPKKTFLRRQPVGTGSGAGKETVAAGNEATGQGS